MVLEKVPTFQEVKDWAASKTTVDNHINDTNNPHNVSADAPVDDVNGQTGSVNLNYNDVGALADHEYDPEADTHSRYTDSEAASAAPVDSVNGQTGSVNISTGLDAQLVASGSHVEDYGTNVGIYATYDTDRIEADGSYYFTIYEHSSDEILFVAMRGYETGSDPGHEYEVYKIN